MSGSDMTSEEEYGDVYEHQRWSEWKGEDKQITLFIPKKHKNEATGRSKKVQEGEEKCCSQTLTESNIQ